MTKPSPMQSPSELLRNAIKVRFLPLTYEPANSQSSAIRLILTLRPEWKDGQIEIIRFTDGITNTLLKLVNKIPGISTDEIDEEAILLRAYGPGTELIIDREQEAKNHELLMQYNLAPRLLARFHNGILYKFVKGTVTCPADLRKQEIWHAVARRLAEWHAVVPCIRNNNEESHIQNECCEYTTSPNSHTLKTITPEFEAAIVKPFPVKCTPNLWTVLQKWVSALPMNTSDEKIQKNNLQKELDWLIPELSNRPGPNNNSLVFAHCDLLSGNIIVLPQSVSGASATPTVSFIDYEYATPSPAAFDIANHFAEWGGLGCDYRQLPTQSQRIDFIREYITSYYKHLRKKISTQDHEIETNRLISEVDYFRGLPGLYWGIWSLIQTKISTIVFDYASYAKVRLDEYWAWRAENDGTRIASGDQTPLREVQWAKV